MHLSINTAFACLFEGASLVCTLATSTLNAPSGFCISHSSLSFSLSLSSLWSYQAKDPYGRCQDRRWVSVTVFSMALSRKLLREDLCGRHHSLSCQDYSSRFRLLSRHDMTGKLRLIEHFPLRSRHERFLIPVFPREMLNYPLRLVHVVGFAWAELSAYDVMESSHGSIWHTIRKDASSSSPLLVTEVPEALASRYQVVGKPGR